MGSHQGGGPMKTLGPKQRQALEAILRSLRQRGYFLKPSWTLGHLTR